MNRPTVLVLMGCFGRGIEATGPNQSMIGIARTLGDKFDFRIIAEAVEGDKVGEWQTVSDIPQMPIPKGLAGSRHLLAAIRATPHDILLTNGFFDRTMTLAMLIWRKLGMIPQRPTFVAPHGEFSAGALGLKSARKRMYAAALKKSGMLNDVSFIATNDAEADAIRSEGDFGRPIFVCPTIRPLPPMPEVEAAPADGPLRMVFASRIDYMKNLDFAIHAAGQSGAEIVFNIYGPVSSDQFWEQCQEMMAKAPDNLTVSYKGILRQSEILQVLANHDIMFLPTLGENFGHAIADALLAGTPVLISDRTPWRGLTEAMAGWDFPLEQPAQFIAAIRQFDTLTVDERAKWRRSARAFAESQLDTKAAMDALESALTSQS